MLWEISNLNTYPSFRSVRFPDLQIYLSKYFAQILSRHVGVPPRDTNMAVGK